MKWLWFYIVCWKHRNDTRFEMFEQYTLILKAARRCGYDLNHGADAIWRAGRDSAEDSDCSFYTERSRDWLDIFSPTGAKDYRHGLHLDIWKLESEIKEAEKSMRRKWC